MRMLFLSVLVGLTACSPQADVVVGDLIPTLHLEEIVRIGTMEGPEETQFSSPGALDIDPDTREIFVGDAVSGNIRVFDRHGQFLRSFGRRGQGPGEFNEMPVFSVARDTVLVLDRTRMHLFDRDGGYLKSAMFKMADGLALPMGVYADSRGWVGLTMEMDPYAGGRGAFERYYRIDARDAVVEEPFFEVHHREETQGLFFQQQRAAVVGDGFVTTTGPEYELRYHPTPQSEPLLLRFEVAPVPVSPDALKEYASARRGRCEGSGNPTRCLKLADDRIAETASRPVPAKRPVVGGLQGSSVGLVLVKRADLDPTPFHDGGDTRWDLVHVDGHLVGALDFPPGFSPRWLTEGEVWGFQLGDYDVPFVVGYRLEAKGNAPNSS